MSIRIPPYDVVEDNLAEMFSSDSETPKDVFYLAPNVKRPGEPERDCHIDREQELHLDLGALEPSGETGWFQTAFAPELEKLRNVYDNVTVKWGLHQYFR